MMTRTKKLAVVAVLTTKLREKGSWGGETHVQKAVYFLQELLGIPTGFEFVLYKHGPFSFDLRDTIGMMKAEGMLELQQRPYPYGPSLMVPSRQQNLLLRQMFQEKYSDGVEFIAAELAELRVSKLEELATGLYMKRQHPMETEVFQARRVIMTKPHILFEDAVASIQAVKAMTNLAAPIREGLAGA